MSKFNKFPAQPMDKGILYILSGVLAVFVIVVGVEIAIDATMTTGIDLRTAINIASGN